MPADAAPAPGGLAELTAAHLRDRPRGTALIDEAGALDYRGFDALCDRTAHWLAAQGIEAGDKVAVWLPNRREWLALLCALARLGATLVAINTRYRSSELEYILARSRACMLVMQPSFRKIDFPAVLAGVPQDALPDLRTIALVDADGDAPAPVFGRHTVAWRPDAGQPADRALPSRSIAISSSALLLRYGGASKT
ncbi:AMP-binding protein, partial [Bordetella petrii]|uniref:AMP-binding protein n=1 Tax=Bordetella petrii TaxID=94624 RepID=UPI001E4243CE